MKHYIKTLSLLVFVFMSLSFTACEDDDLDLYKEVVGESTATAVFLTISTDEAAPGESITISYEYVNSAEDPAETIEIFQLIDGEKTLIESFDESSQQTDVLISKEVTYTIPGGLAEDTGIAIHVYLTTTKPFPDVSATSLTVL